MKRGRRIRLARKRFSNNPETYGLVKKLVDEGKTRYKIAQILATSYPTLYQYIRKHPELEINVNLKERQKLGPKSYGLIKRLVDEGDTCSEISSILGVCRYTVTKYLNKYPELRENLVDGRSENGQKKDEKIYNEVLDLILKGKTVQEIAMIRNVPSSTIYSYIQRHPELKENLIDGRGLNSGRPQDKQLYKEIQDLISQELTQVEIAKKRRVVRQEIYQYVKRYPELKELYKDIRSKK